MREWERWFYSRGQKKSYERKKEVFHSHEHRMQTIGVCEKDVGVWTTLGEGGDGPRFKRREQEVKFGPIDAS